MKAAVFFLAPAGIRSENTHPTAFCQVCIFAQRKCHRQNPQVHNLVNFPVLLQIWVMPLKYPATKTEQVSKKCVSYNYLILFFSTINLPQCRIFRNRNGKKTVKISFFSKKAVNLDEIYCFFEGNIIFIALLQFLISSVFFIEYSPER